MTGKALSNAAYMYGVPQDKTEGYTANGLNQYPTVTQGGVTFNLTYDLNGSLTGDGAEFRGQYT